MPTIPARLWFLGILLFCSRVCEGEEISPPEAAPLIAVLQAAKASDVANFKEAYSRRIREDTEQGDWESNLKEARANLERRYGDYAINEFGFTFAGDKENGTISLKHKGKESLSLKVINEGGGWKLDER